MTAFAAFVVELRTSERFGSLADEFTKAFREVEIESGKNWHVHNFRKALTWIVSQPRTLEEKLVAFDKLMSLPNCHVLIPSMRRLVGWRACAKSNRR